MPQPPSDLMNNEAKPGYDETKSAQQFHMFHQLGAPGNGPAVRNLMDQMFFCLRPSDPQMLGPST